MRLLGAFLTLWARLLPGRHRDALVGDLREGWSRHRARSGRARALGWLLGEVFRTPYVGLWKSGRRSATRTGPTTARTGGAGMGWMREFQVALRTLRRRTGFAGVAITTLALSVGMATLVFSLFQAVLLRPLPYPDDEQLHRIYGTNQAWREGEQEMLRSAWDRTPLSREMIDTWAGAGLRVGSFQPASAAVRAGPGPTEFMTGARVGPGFFPTVGAPALLGRLPTPAEVDDFEPVVVIAESLWSRSFQRDPAALGRTVEIDGVAYTVIGVLPTDFALPTADAAYWAPYPEVFQDYRDANVLSALLRIPEGRTREATAEALDAGVARLVAANPSYEVMGARLVSLREEVLGSVSDGLTLLLGAVLLVALIACVNLTNLVVARVTRRTPELAMRAALGAGRGGLIATVLVEVLLVCGIGALVGVGGAYVALDPTVAYLVDAMPDFPRTHAVSLNGTVLLFSLGLTVATALVAGVLPAIVASRRPPARILQGGPKGGRTQRVRSVQRALLFAEAALAMILLAGAGLLTRSVAQLFTLDPGFESESIAYVGLRLPSEEFGTDAEVRTAVDELILRLRGVSGVSDVVPAIPLPTLGGSTMVPVRADGTPPEDAALTVLASVGPRYFESLGIPVLRGRGFVEQDDEGAEAVAVMSEVLARRIFGEENPVGRYLTQGSGAIMTAGEARSSDEEPVRVVGVVGEVRQIAIVREDPVLYRPFAQNSRRQVALALVVDEDLAPVLADARAAIAEVPGTVLLSVGSMRAATLEVVAPLTVRTILLGALAGLAALLAMVGVYGVVAYVVSDQTREIGIRMALGSRARGETGRMVRQALGPILAGTVLGLLVALGFSGILESSIHEVGRLDPLAYGGTFALLITVAAAAAWWPARRAAGVDPVEVLRGE